MRAEGWAEAEKANAQREQEPLGEYRQILGHAPRASLNIVQIACRFNSDALLAQKSLDLTVNGYNHSSLLCRMTAWKIQSVSLIMP